ncbi:MAG: D-alanyl-D-alanine carboxypeptidase [Lachnospiraceae bacterium]|nr:D-alanyl-D-alanine carboxypeptidase [Lachnospiraceae bacterium]
MKRITERLKNNKKTIAIIAMAVVFLFFIKYKISNESAPPALTLRMVSENEVIKTGSENIDLSLYANASALYDATERRFLYGENENESLPMASTTKIMTCILVLEAGCLEEWAEVSSYAASQPKVRADLRAKERYLVGDLLYSLMLESHNDTAVVLAEHVGGSVEGFAEMMNAKANELGLTDTYFITPNGLDACDEGGVHSTTACDLAILAAYAMENETFREIIQTENYTFLDETGAHAISVTNANAFLDLRDGALGIKTGYTDDAGYCFVGASEEEGHLLISVVLGAGWPPHREYKWEDTGELMDYARDNYEEECILLSEVMLEYAWGEQEGYVAGDGYEEMLYLSAFDEVTVESFYADELHLETIPDETVIGWRSICLNGVEIERLPLVFFLKNR